LFKADFKFDQENDGIIWVQKIQDPRAFGVVKVNADNVITDFVEKPQEFVSDLAIIGIYFFKDGDNLKKELRYLIDNNIKEKGEFQLTNALENMKSKGIKFSPGQISEWLDCGNKDATVYTNQRILEFKSKSEKLVNDSAVIENSVIVPPCYIGAGVKIINSVVGPYASVGVKTVIKNSIVSNSIIQAHTKISNSNLTNSMVGNNAELEGRILDLSIGDFNSIKQ
jgi:glucose-1-phosphate thymidylyltransferase